MDTPPTCMMTECRGVSKRRVVLPCDCRTEFEYDQICVKFMMEKENKDCMVQWKLLMKKLDSLSNKNVPARIVCFDAKLCAWRI